VGFQLRAALIDKPALHTAIDEVVRLAVRREDANPPPFDHAVEVACPGLYDQALVDSRWRGGVSPERPAPPRLRGKASTETIRERTKRLSWVVIVVLRALRNLGCRASSWQANSSKGQPDDDLNNHLTRIAILLTVRMPHIPLPSATPP
jgi:hypothetical protein